MKCDFSITLLLLVLLGGMGNFYVMGQGPMEWKKKGEEVFSRGALYLIQTQNEDGSWGTHRHPAIASLAVIGVLNAGVQGADVAVEKALKYILQFQQPEGSIYPAELHKKNINESAYYPNYTTSVVLLCLTAVNKPEYYPIMLRARRYLMSIQFRDPSQVDFGGIGYGKTQRADLSNTAWAAEALYYSEFLEREPYVNDPGAMTRVKEMWKGIASFVEKCQNLPEVNRAEYVSSHPEDLGGFFYRPTESKAGERKNETEGVSKLVSSGSMTYAGLKSMLYAQVSKDDIRVKGALRYLRSHYTLDENPGMGQQGLFYYLLTMAKALSAWGEEQFTDEKGVAHNWRKEIAEKLGSLQRNDGSWQNENARFFESDPTLATAYALISLKLVLGKDELSIIRKP